MVKKGMLIAKDRVVSIDYTLCDPEGREIDSSKGSGPLSYLHGHGNIISGLEKELEGKTEGDSLKVLVPAAEAYGLHDEKLVVQVPRDRFQGVDEIQVGMQFEAETPDGSRLVTVSAVDADNVSVDANHPLAGMDLSFDVTIMVVRAASEAELEHGHPHVEQSGGCGCGGDCGDDCSCDEGGCGDGGCGCH